MNFVWLDDSRDFQMESVLCEKEQRLRTRDISRSGVEEVDGRNQSDLRIGTDEIRIHLGSDDLPTVK